MKFSVLLFASCSGTLAMCWRLFSLFIILNVFATEVHSENVDKSKPHIIVMVADDFGKQNFNTCIFD